MAESTLTFLGAARTVTGSKYLLRSAGATLLIDAGLFQGLKELRERNWRDFPFKPSEIDAIVLTHAHIDHCGYLPRLVKQGFRGRVYCTAGTQDLCRIVLPDAGRLQEEDAEEANRGQYTRHAPALPLYTEADAFRAISLLQPMGYDRSIPLTGGLEVDFINAGHLLGSAYARIRGNGTTMLFGGDLGRFGRPVLPDPTMVEEADYLLVESTYGDRVHERDDDGEKLASVIQDAAGRGGKIIVPSFAIGRVEELIYWIKKLEDARRIPTLPVYVDSPMAIEALARYRERLHELDVELQEQKASTRSPRERDVCTFCTNRFRAIASVEESKQLTRSKGPSIVISSSGMATGGRVLHHLKAGLPDPRNTVLFVGYQAEGTRGRRLVEGEPAVKIHGQMVPVHAKIALVESMSAHADSLEILRWLGGFKRAPKTTFIVHGEVAAMEALVGSIQSKLQWTTRMPQYEETVTL